MEKKTTRPGLLQITLITKQHFGTTPTYCTKCKKRVTFKMIRADSSYTQMCACGCSLIQFHKPDTYHKGIFYTKKFIPAKKYDPNYKGKDDFEKEGFKKVQENGKTVYSK